MQLYRIVHYASQKVNHLKKHPAVTFPKKIRESHIANQGIDVLY